MTDAVSVLSSCEQTLAIFLPLPFLCSLGQKVEVKTFPSGSGCISPILPCSCQKIEHPKACFSLSNKSYTSVKRVNLPPPFPAAFMLFAPLPFEFAARYRSQVMAGTHSLEPKAWQISLSPSLWCPALWLEAENITAAEVKKHSPLLIIWLVLLSTKK